MIAAIYPGQSLAVKDNGEQVGLIRFYDDEGDETSAEYAVIGITEPDINGRTFCVWIEDYEERELN